jgi:diaminohydroxyphosphoribosylaminopyrimidine deaminase/5-amino-6-(5-phosphoribosylamino)uracil reductase
MTVAERGRRAAKGASERQAALDAELMARALRAAKSGDPSPNPHVGAVVARGAKLISVGHHARCGGPHAEIVALRRAGARARGATLYVTLEPCNHHGRTPPCTEAILAAGVARVVVGCADPAPHVPGAYARLRAHGIEVQHGVLEEPARRLIADFAKVRTRGLPWVTLKAAVTLDGRTAARSGESKWITGPEARKEAHRLRVQSDAVLVGVGTVLADDPELTVRAVRGRNPLRVVLDSRLRTPLTAKLVTTARDVATLVLHARGASRARVVALAARGVLLAQVKKARRGHGLDMQAVLRELVRRGVVRLLVEGGAQVHAGLLEAGLVDAAAVFVAPRILGDMQAIPLVASNVPRSLTAAFVLERPEVVRLGDDVLFRGDISIVQAAAPSRSAGAAKAGPRKTTRL